MGNQELLSKIGSKSGSGYLKDALSKAINRLAQDANNKEDIVQGIESETIESIERYAKIFSEILEGFDGLFARIDSMRSSYLPYDFVKDTIDSAGRVKSVTELSSEQSIMESYENTFLRMLGMPSSADLEDAVKLNYVNLAGNLDMYDEVRFTRNVLDKRQTPIENRDCSVGIDFFNLLERQDPIRTLIYRGYNNASSSAPSNTDKIIEILAKLKILFDLGTLYGQDAKAAADAVAAIVDSYKFSKQLSESSKAKFVSNEENFKSFISKFKEEKGAGDEDPFILSGYREVLNHITFLINPEYESISEEVLSGLFDKYILEAKPNKITNLNNPQNFWRFSCLVFPPVQDGRIGQCINEPSKIVAEPFLPESMRKINGNIMQTSLLEAVIRIRLDIVTGTTKLSVYDFSRPAISLGNNNPNGITYGDIAEDYGILEAYLVARLFNSFAGIAKFCRDKIKEIQIQQAHTNMVPKGGRNRLRGNSADSISAGQNNEKEKLNSLKVIDDSMLLLLGKNEFNKAIDLQENVARNSGIIDAHFMDVVVSAITYPSKWTDQKIKKKDDSNLAAARTDLDSGRDFIDKTLGRARGIGTIDVMAFILAMFSIREEDLISLLNEKQFGYLKEEFPKDFFEDLDRVDIGVAVNKLSEAAFDSYELFREILSDSSQEGLFVYQE